MSSALQPVGVQLVAEDEAEFNSALQRAAEQVNALDVSVIRLNASVKDEATAEQLKIAILAQENQEFIQFNQTINITNNVLVDNTKAANAANDAHGGFYSQLRAGRIAVAAITAEMALMTIVAGQQLPDGLREVAKGLQLIVDLGTTGFLLGGGPGAIIGAIAGAILTLAAAGATASQPIQDLDTKLQQLAKKDELITTLTQVTGVSDTVAKSWLDAAAKSPAFAQALEQVATAAQPVPPLIDAIRSAMDALEGSMGKFPDVGNALVQALRDEVAGYVYLGSEIKQFANDPLKFLSDEQGAYAEAFLAEEKYLAEFDQGLKGIAPDIATVNKLNSEAADILYKESQALKEAESAQQSYADAVDKTNDAIAKLNVKTGEQYAQAQQQYNDAIAKAGGSLDDARTKAQVAQDDADVKLRQQYNERIAAIDQQLADRRTDIATQLADRLFDIQTRLGDALASAEETLQTRLAAIDSQQKDSLISLDKSTAEQIRTAQTQHDIEEIKRKAEIQKEAINLRTGDEKTAAQNEYEQRVQQAEQAAREEIAIANRTAAEQRTIANRTASEQRATAVQTAQDGEKAAAKAFADASAAAVKAYNDAKDAAVAALAARDKAINSSYANERQQIEATYQDALAKLEALILKVNEFNLAAVYALSLQGFIQQLGLTPSTSSPISSFSPNVLGNLFGGAVPHGLSAGGSVSNVFSPSTTSNGQTYNFYINGAFAPQDIVKEIDKYLLDHQH